MRDDPTYDNGEPCEAVDGYEAIYASEEAEAKYDTMSELATVANLTPIGASGEPELSALWFALAFILSGHRAGAYSRAGALAVLIEMHATQQAAADHLRVSKGSISKACVKLNHLLKSASSIERKLKAEKK